MKKHTIGTKIGAEVRKKANKFSAAKRARLMKRGMATMRWIGVRECERFLTGHMTVLRFARIAGLGKRETDIHCDVRPVLEALQYAHSNLTSSMQRAIASIQKMSPSQRRQSLIDAGILTPKGELAPPYRAFVPDLVTLRSWKGKRAITRTMVLLVCLDQLLVPGALQHWLERRRCDLDNLSPVDLIKRGEWTVLGDLIDDMLTGAPN